MGIRKPLFMGTWYPGTKRECDRMIDGFMEDLPASRGSGGHFRGGIVPHAGWYFSGKTAFSVFHRIYENGETAGSIPDTFFIFGMHLPPGGSDYIFLDDGVETPYGIVDINREAAERLAGSFNFIVEDANGFSQDNTIELQFPFIKRLFPEAKIVTAGISPGENALAVGERAYEIADALGISACFIGSTDLTHYGPNYGFMPHGIGEKGVRWVREVNDSRIIDLFLRADGKAVIPEALGSSNACCPGGVAAAIGAVGKAGVRRGELVEYTTSYDIHPDSSFVGYAGIVY